MLLWIQKIFVVVICAVGVQSYAMELALRHPHLEMVFYEKLFTAPVTELTKWQAENDQLVQKEVANKTDTSFLHLFFALPKDIQRIVVLDLFALKSMEFFPKELSVESIPVENVQERKKEKDRLVELALEKPFFKALDFCGVVTGHKTPLLKQHIEDIFTENNERKACVFDDYTVAYELLKEIWYLEKRLERGKVDNYIYSRQDLCALVKIIEKTSALEKQLKAALGDVSFLYRQKFTLKNFYNELSKKIPVPYDLKSFVRSMVIFSGTLIAPIVMFILSECIKANLCMSHGVIKKNYSMIDCIKIYAPYAGYVVNIPVSGLFIQQIYKEYRAGPMPFSNQIADALMVFAYLGVNLMTMRFILRGFGQILDNPRMPFDTIEIIFLGVTGSAFLMVIESAIKSLLTMYEKKRVIMEFNQISHWLQRDNIVIF